MQSNELPCSLLLDCHSMHSVVISSKLTVEFGVLVTRNWLEIFNLRLCRYYVQCWPAAV